MTTLRPSAALPLLAALALLSGRAGAETPVGVDACRECHPRAVAIWEASAHARADKGLGERAKEAACLSCHAPLRDAGQAGVTCEACHGGGEHYAKPYVMRDRELSRAVGLVMPGNRECRACHDSTSPSLTAFDFDAALKLVEHGKADREARKAGLAGPKVPSQKPVPKIGPPPPRPPTKLDDRKERAR